MGADVDLAHVAAAIGHPVRSEFLLALLGGEPLPASELAERASVSPSTASGHLNRLAVSGLVQVEARGRHRLYRLSRVEVAGALEALARVAPVGEVRSLRASQQADAFRIARSCYDHLAGALAIEVADALRRQGVIGPLPPGGVGALHEGGHEQLRRLGIDVDALMRCRREVVRGCLDWSERKPHLAGGLGAAVLSALLERRWVERRRKDRALTVTSAGARGLRAAFAIDVAGVAKRA